jgi:hypothetical protein
MAKTEYVYPGSDLDRSRILLSLLGTFWSRTYTAADQLTSYAGATAYTLAQTHRTLLETVAALSRYDVPLFHKELLVPIVLRRSELNTALTNVVLFNENTGQFDGQLVFDGVAQSQLYSFPLPAKLRGLSHIFNKITFPTVALAGAVDFLIDVRRNALVFTQNPFDNPGFLKRAGGTASAADEELLLWGFYGEFDYEYVFDQFAYAVGLRLRTSENYKTLVNTIFSGLLDGGMSAQNLDIAFSAICGIPLVIEPQETVEVVEYGNDGLLIATDKNVYKFADTATPAVRVGDTVGGGAQLVRGFEINEFFVGNTYAADAAVVRPDITRFLVTNTYDTVAAENQDDIVLDDTQRCPPPPQPLAALALDAGFLATCFYGDLVFENRELPLHVDTAHGSGYTFVSFPLGGFPNDAARFFDELHNRGVAAASVAAVPCFADPLAYPTLAALPTPGLAGRVYVTVDDQKYYEWLVRPDGSGAYTEITRLPVVKKLGTLAHLLDRRQNPSGEPTAHHLPATINPMRFLIENVLRNNVFVVKIDAAALGQNRLGLYNIRHLRQILPPQTAMIVVFELHLADDKIKSAQVITETFQQFTGLEPQSDTVTPAYVTDEGAVLTKLSGTCQ